MMEEMVFLQYILVYFWLICFPFSIYIVVQSRFAHCVLIAIINRYILPYLCTLHNVTLDDEFHGKDFISHKQKNSDQFGTKIDIVPLSQTFKKIKNESRFFIQFWTDFVIDIILFLSEDQKKKSRIHTKYSRNLLRMENSLSAVENS